MYIFSHISVVSPEGSPRRCCLHLHISNPKTSWTTKPFYNPRRHACNGVAPHRTLCGVERHCRSCVPSRHLYRMLQPQIATDDLSIPLYSGWCNIHTLSLLKTLLASMTTSDWFSKNTARNEANEPCRC